MNEDVKKECIKICDFYKININFNNINWENEFIKNIDWHYISFNTYLSENFIEYFQDYIDWCNISKRYTIVDHYIKTCYDFQSYINAQVCKLSDDFIKKYKDKLSEFIWFFKSNKEKENDIKEAGYKILKDKNGKYILAYKAIKINRRSYHDPENYKYIVGKEYESDCDCFVKNPDSYGLAVWDKENAIKFGLINSIKDFRIIKVKIYIDDIGVIIKENNNKIRCFKFKVIEDLGIFNENIISEDKNE